MRSGKLRDEEEVPDFGHALNIKDNKITNSIAYNTNAQAPQLLVLL